MTASTSPTRRWARARSTSRGSSSGSATSTWSGSTGLTPNGSDGLASFSRLILHDRRGTGASSRNVAPPNLETRVADLRAVLDVVGSERAVLGGTMEGGGPNVLFAASDPERVHSIVWWYPAPRTTRAPDYPFGADDQLLERSSRDIRDIVGHGRIRDERAGVRHLRVHVVPLGEVQSTDLDSRRGPGDGPDLQRDRCAGGDARDHGACPTDGSRARPRSARVLRLAPATADDPALPGARGA